ncbi:hypothetical protein AAON49_06360 [Pseudotenacibaculum sp. MALMAid0570]|uniref:hypothetical protein n=1 Tax=Pseudotenacibaculum sp. MALMAid0570 TaxID=3143938 RepID=UPI0032DEF002
MKNKNWIFFLLIGIISLTGSAQEGNFTRSGTTGVGIDLTSWSGLTFRNNLATENSRDGNKVTEEFYESVTGDSPYVNNVFAPAKVNKYKDVVTARYDAYKDLVVVKINDSKALYLEKRLGNKVYFMATRETYQIFYGEKERAEFFKIVKTGKKSSLLLKQEVVLRGGEKPRSTYDTYVAPFFKRLKDKLYISLDNKNAVKLPTNKKKFLKLFNDKESKIKSFVKKNKLNIKNQGDIGKILSYYATL